VQLPESIFLVHISKASRSEFVRFSSELDSVVVPASIGLEVLVGAGVVDVVVAVVVDAVSLGDDFFLFSVFFGCFILPESLAMLL